MNAETRDAGPRKMPTLIEESVLLEPDRVRILDRRVFPFEKKFVDCRTVEEVARAIEEMVTQSGGPFFAAGAALVLAAREAERDPSTERRAEAIGRAGRRLVATRPTNDQIAHMVEKVAGAARQSAARPGFGAAVEAEVRALWEERRARSRALGANCATVLADGDSVLTHCWGEAAIVESLAAAQRQGKRLKVVCTETRPYLQGARLTAHSVAELGIDVTVITDNMAAHAMAQGMVTKFVTASDRVAMSGHVVNKVGTYLIAIAAHRHAIPFYALAQAPDRSAATGAEIPIEMRDPEESLTCMGMRTASPLVRHGWYPAFDVTPPDLVTGIVTSRGVFAPDRLHEHFERAESSS